MDFEKIKAEFNFQSNLFDIYKFENGQVNADDENLIFSGSILTLADQIIEDSLWHLISNKISHNSCTQSFLDTVYVSIVKKSVTKKSVHQYNLDGDKCGASYNLPERFRDKKFGSILADKIGPFTSKKINGTYLQVDPWSYYEVFFVGSTKECIYEFEKRYVKTFLEHHIGNALIEASEQCNGIQQLNKLHEIKKEFSTILEPDVINDRINFHYKKIEEIEHQEQDNLGYEDE